MNIGILPNDSFISLKRDVNSAISARFRTGRLRKNQVKKPKRNGDKSAVAFGERCATVGLRIAGHRAARILIDFTQRAQKSWDQFDAYDSQGLHCVTRTSEKTKIHR